MIFAPPSIDAKYKASSKALLLAKSVSSGELSDALPVERIKLMVSFSALFLFGITISLNAIDTQITNINSRPNGKYLTS